MDFTFGDFVEFKNSNGESVFIDPTKILVVEQDHTDKNSCGVFLAGASGPFYAPMSAEKFVWEVKKVREKSIKRLTSLE